MSTASPAKPARSSRYDWVDIAKGICIVAVVGLYARNELERVFGATGWLEPWSAFARPFRMPDFFLLSGLFLSAVIDRPWRSYLDTKVVHYAYFLVIWIPLLLLWDLLFLGVVAPLGDGPAGVAKLFVWGFIFPDHMLWFIQTLPLFFVVTRLLKRVPALLLWAASAALMVASPDFAFKPINNFSAYYVFFLTGHLAARHIFAHADRAAARPAVTMVLFVAWCVLNQAAVSAGYTAIKGPDLFFGFLGISAIIALSSVIGHARWLSWLRYAGSHSIVIYLGFYIPLTLFLHLVAASGIQVEANVLATAAVVVGAGTPLLLNRLIAGTALRLLFVRPRWAYIAAPRRAAPTAAVQT